MGTYANNSYNLTIPLAEVGTILTEFRDAVQGTWYTLPDEWAGDAPEALVNAIVDTFGAEEKVDFTTTDSDLTIVGYSYGKVGEVDLLARILAAYGTTGTVESEVEGEWILGVFKDGRYAEHIGVVAYPTYEAES